IVSENVVLTRSEPARAYRGPSAPSLPAAPVPRSTPPVTLSTAPAQPDYEHRPGVRLAPSGLPRANDGPARQTRTGPETRELVGGHATPGWPPAERPPLRPAQAGHATVPDEADVRENVRHDAAVRAPELYGEMEEDETGARASRPAPGVSTR